VQLLVVPVKLEQLGSQVLHTPLITTSFVFEHELWQVFEVVTTKVPLQLVQVVVEISQVLQLESQGKQELPLSIVKPVSQLFWQVSSLKSNFMLDTHDAQVVVVPEQVLQFELQSLHWSRVELYTVVSAGQDETHVVPYKM
jgi:hypothetical protein